MPGKRIDELPRGANSSLKASVLPLLTILSRFPPASDPSITLSAAGNPIIQVLSTWQEKPWSNALKIFKPDGAVERRQKKECGSRASLGVNRTWHEQDFWHVL
ncbi:hypothetical protein [Pseudoxanthomonas sp. UTMC 1351]|uniref:hypothetical protein n=1 Tax=Pseudoxanthomonas sp. UTMC 1351 TaxID=2695853 RepID=UPI0034CD99BA